ncbi:metallophosphoesterase family protein [Desnuesiella massiliensis]|uniref:metallophosphoesterase family protein n=1 Tax=Desnuesiella massiliensis TaxID=1650662 RepID=UPI0006E43301|nr:metallophosphoesterase [Desnuesiella massiliensis]
MGSIKFALFTDLHHDVIPDGLERLSRFMTRARKAEVDFIIELGDFCHPCDKNKELLSMFNDFEKPHYHVIGNHDSDLYTKKDVMNWLGMEHSYYSFECGNIKFIVLDSAFIQYGNEFEAYYRRNYEVEDGIYPSIPDYELTWLQREISESLLPIVIFSHHSLENNFRKRGVSNREAVQSIINHGTVNGKKILLCINGHDHADSIDKIDKTYYFTLNSISYKWFGPEFEHFCYSSEIHAKCPYLKDIVLYSEPLSAIISIDEQYNIDIQGMEGGYEKITPKELGITGPWDGRTISPNVSSDRLVFE